MAYSVVNSFCNYINITIKDTNDLKYKNYKIGYLICKLKPAISIENYIRHIFTYGIVDKNNIDGIILYTINILNRLKTKGLYLNFYNCHRILLTSLMLSSKIHEDCYYSNSDWAKICGTNIRDINTMELVILELLDFDLNIIISQQKAINIFKSIY